MRLRTGLSAPDRRPGVVCGVLSPGGGGRQHSSVAHTARTQQECGRAPVPAPRCRGQEQGRPARAWKLILRRTYPMWPCSVSPLPCSRAAVRSHTCLRCPVARMSRLSHPLIALKLQFTWITFDGPEKIPAPSDGLAAGG